jgi:aspartate-semialdehyde dehydrogenase
MGKGYNVAVVGATGAVGREMVEVLAERGFPVNDLRLLASHRSAGEEIDFGSQSLKVEELKSDSFQGINLALFSAGAAVSKQFAPLAVKAGSVVVDNSSAFRMEPDVPLVVPEVNPQALAGHKGIIANPNCSTIQMVVVLKPIHDQAGIKRVVVSTYQSVSGTGKRAMDELFEQSKLMICFQKDDIRPMSYPHQIAFNCLPHIDEFLENGYTKEEMKMVNETRKILGEETLPITATTVRVPVFIGHSESVNVETDRKLTAAQVREILSHAPGVVVADDPANCIYPLPLNASGTDETFVGRIREDESVACGLNLWIVADNLRKGAALNAVQIAELLVEQGLM